MSADLDSLHPQLCELFAMHCNLARLGFPLSQLYTVVLPGADDDVPHLYLIVRTRREGKEDVGRDPGDFNIDLEPLAVAPEAILDGYKLWNASSQQERDALWLRSNARRGATDLIATMTLAGFLPREKP